MAIVAAHRPRFQWLWLVVVVGGGAPTPLATLTKTLPETSLASDRFQGIRKVQEVKGRSWQQISYIKKGLKKSN